MFRKIRKISSIEEWHGYECDQTDNVTNSLFIVAQDDKVGIVDNNETIIVDIMFDSITPLGGGIWLVRKNTKHGIIRFDINENKLYLAYAIPCEYDYVYRNDLDSVILCIYDEVTGKDYTDTYISKKDALYKELFIQEFQ